jgi:hypothetical protein
MSGRRTAKSPSAVAAARTLAAEGGHGSQVAGQLPK